MELVEAHPDRSFKVKDLARALHIPRSDYRRFRAAVLDTARAGRIAALPRRRFQASGGAVFLEGTVAGVGPRATHVVFPQEPSLPLATGALDHVVPGDVVRVRRIRDRDSWLAHVQQVVEAAPREVFGELERIGGRWVLIPDRAVPGFRGGAFVDESVELPPSADGSLARGHLSRFQPSTERPVLQAVELLGPADHPRAAMARRIARDGWPRDFGAEAVAQAEAGREDPRPRPARDDDLVFTIDPLTAQDHDDAVSIRRTDDGGFVLAVHIADVASYVPEGTPLDDEALERTTSVYPPGQVLPMLPHVLSGGECSLHHGVRRRTLTAEMTYDADGARRGVALGRTTIRSRASLAYEHAQALLDAGEAPPRERSEVEPPDLERALRDMLALAERLRARRREAGSLFVERPERSFEFDDEGYVSGVKIRESLTTHWIIEEFMLEANRAVAESLHAARLPLLWRVHPDPDEGKVEDLVGLLRDLGIRWRPAVPPTGHDYTQLFDLVRDRDDAPLIHLLSLRSLMKAQYRAGWDGHFGLAFNEYTHFTSPIRRYPDLHNQRWLHTLIDAVAPDTGWIDDALRASREVARRGLGRGVDQGRVVGLADLCSDLERQAMLIERDCMDICAADHLKGREGDAMEGMIVSLVNSGLFVELDGAGIDGFVGVEQLPVDWYRLDDKRHAFVGERTGRTFRLGQRVRVLLEHVDVENGRVWVGSIQPVSRKKP